MALKRDIEDDAPMRRAVDELKSILTEAFPGAVFKLGPGYDPDGLYLDVIWDTPDFDDFSDKLDELVGPRVMELWAEGVDLFVIPGLPPHRIAERREAIKAGRL